MIMCIYIQIDPNIRTFLLRFLVVSLFDASVCQRFHPSKPSFLFFLPPFSLTKQKNTRLFSSRFSPRRPNLQTAPEKRRKNASRNHQYSPNKTATSHPPISNSLFFTIPEDNQPTIPPKASQFRIHHSPFIISLRPHAPPGHIPPPRSRP